MKFYKHIYESGELENLEKEQKESEQEVSGALKPREILSFKETEFDRQNTLRLECHQKQFLERGGDEISRGQK